MSVEPLDRAHVPHDDALERLFCGWLLQAEPDVRARSLARIRPELFYDPVCSAFVRLFRTRVAAAADVDAVSLIQTVSAERGHSLYNAFGEMHEEWWQYGTPGTILLGALEDWERQRVAHGIKTTPLATTGQGSITAIRTSLDRAPDTLARPTASVLDMCARLTTTWDQEKPTTLKTGVPTVDGLVGGFKRGDLVVVGARTSVGKSVFALWLARGICAADRTVLALYDSLEMPGQELVKRMLADEAGIENYRVQRGDLYAGERERVMQASQTLADRGGLHFLDLPGGTWVDRLAAYEQHCAIYPATSLLVVDYIGLIRGVDADKRYQELGTITHDLKNLARRRNLVVIAVSQLNRASEKDAAPQLSALRESGDIEQDADVVLLLYQPPAMQRSAPCHPEADPLAMIVAKNREGALGTIELDFFRKYCRILEPGA